MADRGNPRTVAALLVLAVALAACSFAESPGVRLTGSIFTDVQVDSPCDRTLSPRELAGVVVTFRDTRGAILAEAVTGPLQSQPLEDGPGREGWVHPGCRFYAAYVVDVPRVEAYEAVFRAPKPANPAAGYFDGVNQMGPQRATHAELAAMGFSWSFEAPPAWVVP